MSLRCLYFFPIAFFFLCFAFSCANQLPLTGGPKDETPPQVDTSASIKNYQTNFTKRDIDLVFDEFIDLRDANSQILISPPLEYPPKISNRLKKIGVSFNEEEILKEEATYVINFGKSIRDFTEGNELLNYSFVFSTGDYIDSLSLTGNVIDAKSGEPRKDALVLLYKDHRDSVVYLERPFYFARTDDQGVYRINNLRADSFKVAVMSDENLSYTYDPSTEEIGFIDTLVVLKDTLTSNVNLEIFREATSPRYKSYDVLAQGQAKILFEGRVTTDALRIIDSLESYIHYVPEDPHLTMWYSPRSRKGVQYEIYRGDVLDTIQLRVNTRSTDTLVGRIDITKVHADSKLGHHPLEPLRIDFDRPIRDISMDKIFVVDTLANDTLSIGIDSLTQLPNLTLNIDCLWPKERTLDLSFYPGAITDFFGKTNDTISEFLFVATEVDFGSINLKITNFDSVDHVLRLMKDDKLIDEIVYYLGETEANFDRLLPGTYSVQIIVDEVPNGYWDSGNYLQKRQSERIYKVPLGDLRANWKMEEVLDMNQIKMSKLVPEKDSEVNNISERK